MDAVRLQTARQLIESHQRFVVTTHMSPDGDAVGSAQAICHYLRLKGKEAVVVYTDTPGENLSFIPGYRDGWVYDNQHDGTKDTRTDAIYAIQHTDVIVCVDYNSLSRTGELQNELKRSIAPRLLLDHHLDPKREEFTVLFSHPEWCAACEVVYRFILEMGDDALVDQRMATLLYCGMMTDTGFFTYASARPEIYMILARLLQFDIDKENLHRKCALEYERRTRLKGFVLQTKLRCLYEHKAAYFSLSKNELKNFNHQKGDTEGFVNMPLDIRGIQVSAFFREEKNIIKVSLRSKGDYPVNLLAQKFYNGGGHKNAAGGEFQGSLQLAEALFIKALPMFDQYLEKDN